MSNSYHLAVAILCAHKWMHYSAAVFMRIMAIEICALSKRKNNNKYNNNNKVIRMSGTEENGKNTRKCLMNHEPWMIKTTIMDATQLHESKKRKKQGGKKELLL